ncbi:MAG: sel1 repeat family protein [Bradyrhizobium sp.]|nr:sel1 repeat family protein [Bradyrhizobium sp.]
MVDQPTRYRSYELGSDDLEHDITGTGLRPRGYAFGRSAASEYQSDDSVPLFLSDPDGEPDPAEFDYRQQFREPRRYSIASKILMATLAASAVAVGFAWYSSDATREVLANAKASIATVLPVPSAAAQSDANTQLTPRDVQLKDPTRVSGPASQTPGANTARATQQLAMLPSREDISNAYQAALQNRAPAPAAAAPLAAIAPVAVVPSAAPAPAAAPQPVRQADPEEMANLMQRAKSFLASGDLMSARLLLERAAEMQGADAALLLAQTYDPDVLGTSDVRNTTPEPAKARAWYQKAAQLGSADAQRRLAQLPN